MLVDSTSIPLRNLQSSPPASSHAVVFRGFVLPPPHKRRLWGGGNTSPLKTTAWEASLRPVMTNEQPRPRKLQGGNASFEHSATADT